MVFVVVVVDRERELEVVGKTPCSLYGRCAADSAGPLLFLCGRRRRRELRTRQEEKIGRKDRRQETQWQHRMNRFICVTSKRMLEDRRRGREMARV